MVMQRGWPASAALPAGCPSSFPSIYVLLTFCVLPGSCLLCSRPGNWRACPKPKTTVFLYYASLWKDGFPTADVRSETAKAGLGLAATGTSHGAVASPLCWLGGPGAAPVRSYGPRRCGWMHSEDRWFSTAPPLGGRFAPSSGGLHTGQLPSRPFHPQFCLARPPRCTAVSTYVFLPMHPTSQPPQLPLPSAGAVPVPTSPLLNLGQKEDLKKVSAEADVLLCSCRTSKPWRGTGTTPACQPCTASPRRRWALLSQQRTRGGGKHLSIIRLPWGASPCGCRGPGSSGARGSQQSAVPPHLWGASVCTCAQRRAGKDERG